MKNMRCPNVLFVFPDEFRKDSIGCMQCDPVVTPHLDQFACEGMQITNAVSTYPVCSPYRGQLMTGCYPYSNGVLGNCNTDTARFGVYLTSRKTCISDVFHEAGYECGYIGKWHLSAPEQQDFEYLEPRRKSGQVWDAFTPESQRHHFDFWYSYGCNDHHFEPHYWCNGDSAAQVREIKEWSAKHEADVVIRYLKNEGGVRDASKPFLLFWAPNPPHMPFNQVPEKYFEPYQNKTPEELLLNPNTKEGCIPPAIYDFAKRDYRELYATARREVKNYYASITGIDDQFGRVMDELRKAGLEENTIVVFTSDHGELMGSHSLMYKGEWYRECFEVPFLIRWPEKIPANSICKVFLNPPDIMPTLLDLCGLPDKIPEKIEGVSKAAQILGMSDEIGEGFYNNPQLNIRGVCNEKFFLVVFRDRYDRENTLLYDQLNDPRQMHDCSTQYPEVVLALRKRLDEWLVRTNDLWIR